MSIKHESKRASDNPPGPRFVGERIWCPKCNDYARFIKSAYAARLIGVNRRTIYRYIEQGLVSSFRVVGKFYRVCSSCLLKHAQ